VAELEVLQADVTKLEVDAIANAANTQLMHGGGVAGVVAFGTGVGGFPLDEAARIMVGVAGSHDGALERIVFAVHGDPAEQAFCDALET
jgi:O-acetyl-ADP-ribose deacetylase (regulator of RNase III)